MTQTTPHEQPPDPRSFLEQFPAHRRSTIANWFHYAFRHGAQSPAAVLSAVRQTCARRQQGRNDPDAAQVVAALDADQAGALGYAQYVIEYEALPLDARRKLKAERAFGYLKEAMIGKPPTPAQVSYLHSLGHRGPAPADRQAASQLIDELRQQQRGEA